MPQLNIQATSTLQDYNINVFIYGPRKDPKTVMSSEPPLPQEDIVALLATGRDHVEPRAAATRWLDGRRCSGAAALSQVLQVQAAGGQRVVRRAGSRWTWAASIRARDSRKSAPASRSRRTCFYLIGDLDVGGRYSRNGPLPFALQMTDAPHIDAKHAGALLALMAMLASVAVLAQETDAAEQSAETRAAIPLPRWRRRRPRRAERRASVSWARHISPRRSSAAPSRTRSRELDQQGVSPATADDAAFFLGIYYRKNGYADVTSLGRSPARTSVELDITEGTNNAAGRH